MKMKSKFKILTRKITVKWWNKIIPFLMCVGFIFIWFNEYSSKSADYEDISLLDMSASNIELIGKMNDTTPYPSIPAFVIENKKLHIDLKYILLWTMNYFAPFTYLGKKSQAFDMNKCPESNCYVTSDRNRFGGDLTKFDAIAFNGRNIHSFNASHLPKSRSLHQKYIFFDMESSDNEPVCNQMFDGFFNWTATYKLNSDIVYAYLLIRNKAFEEVGPQVNMTWKVPKVKTVLRFKKSKAAVWVASNCQTRSQRERYVQWLDSALMSYRLGVDLYGACGRLRCPKDKTKFDKMLKNNYFFYLSFENSIAEDYVTEKLYNALNNGIVPIVYGGANYSRFLPPGSYLDAMKYTPRNLAAEIARIMKKPRVYSDFFAWKHYYSYHSPEAKENVCKLCAALNNKTMMETKTVYKDFRLWWNPNYVERCKDKLSRTNGKSSIWH